MKIGDKVKFLNETGGGFITKFIDPETVLVRIEDGFEVPAKLNGLIPEHTLAYVTPEAKQSRTSQQNNGAQKSPSELKNSGQVYLAFTHKDNPYHSLIHLINDTNYHLFYIVGLRKMGQQLYQYSGSLEPDTKVVLGNYRISKKDESSIFSIQYMGFKKGYYVPFEPVHRILEIDAQMLVERQYEKENDFFDTGAAVFSIGEKTIPENLDHERIQKKAKTEGKKMVADKQTSPEIMEVDLHSHEIIEDESGLTDGEILNIQLSRFEIALETAIHGIVKKIVFIHGVGQGKLKYEISKIMDKKYPDLKYQDASFKEYGYGATMIILKN